MSIGREENDLKIDKGVLKRTLEYKHLEKQITVDGRGEKGTGCLKSRETSKIITKFVVESKTLV